MGQSTHPFGRGRLGSQRENVIGKHMGNATSHSYVGMCDWPFVSDNKPIRSSEGRPIMDRPCCGSGNPPEPRRAFFNDLLNPKAFYGKRH